MRVSVLHHGEIVEVVGDVVQHRWTARGAIVKPRSSTGLTMASCAAPRELGDQVLARD
jgi:hypothetical protein